MRTRIAVRDDENVLAIPNCVETKFESLASVAMI